MAQGLTLRIADRLAALMQDAPRSEDRTASEYVRELLRRELTQNLSLPTQRKACADYCERNGLAVDRVFVEEGESAKTADRTEFKKLIAYCTDKRNRIQIVVVYAISRFLRDHAIYVTYRTLLKKHGVTLRSVTEAIDDTASGRFMETVIAGVAQFDNDMKAERTRAGMQGALRLGRWTFRAPLGYVRTGGRGSSIVPDPQRAPMVGRAPSNCWRPVSTRSSTCCALLTRRDCVRCEAGH